MLNKDNIDINDDNELERMVSEYDEKDILDNFSTDISLDSIYQQISNIGMDDVTNSSDLFDNLETTYKHLLKKYENNEDLIIKINDVMLENAESILNKIQERVGFIITFSEAMLNEDKIFLIHIIYSFFICNIESNIESFLFNYFINNVDSFPKIEISKKDQTYLQLKEIISEKYLNQVYNVLDNLNSSCCCNFTGEDIIELMIADDPETLENHWINLLFVDNYMCDIDFGDNFVSKMTAWFTNCTDKIYKIQNKIIKHYSEN